MKIFNRIIFGFKYRKNPVFLMKNECHFFSYTDGVVSIQRGGI